MNIISISDARSKLPSLIDKVNGGFDRFIVTVNNKPRAAILSFEELESWEETLEVMAIPGALKAINEGMEDIKAGRYISHRDLKKKYRL